MSRSGHRGGYTMTRDPRVDYDETGAKFWDDFTDNMGRNFKAPKVKSHVDNGMTAELQTIDNSHWRWIIAGMVTYMCGTIAMVILGILNVGNLYWNIRFTNDTVVEFSERFPIMVYAACITMGLAWIIHTYYVFETTFSKAAQSQDDNGYHPFSPFKAVLTAVMFWPLMEVCLQTEFLGLLYGFLLMVSAQWIITCAEYFAFKKGEAEKKQANSSGQLTREAREILRESGGEFFLGGGIVLKAALWTMTTFTYWQSGSDHPDGTTAALFCALGLDVFNVCISVWNMIYFRTKLPKAESQLGYQTHNHNVFRLREIIFFGMVTSILIGLYVNGLKPKEQVIY